MPGSGRDRDRALAALRRLIAEGEACAFGLDFPFGLPQALLRHGNWEEFALSFGDDYASAGEFRRLCREAAGGRELKRLTDRESQTPFSPYNLRLYRQTYYGIRDVIAPLVRERLVCVPPMQNAVPGRSWVVEICPASTLKLRWPDLYVSYKGGADRHRLARAQIVQTLESAGALSIPLQGVRSDILADRGGDALDSVIAALATCRALQNPLPAGVDGRDAYALEGYVYV